jgi:DNA-binding CsgD family transcriptional regulator
LSSGKNLIIEYQEIADVLFVSFHTINTHIKSIYRKLEVKSRAQALRAARQAGLLDTDG